MGKKRTFKIGEEVYDVPEDKAEGFLSRKPDAIEVSSFIVDKDTFDVPLDKVEGFLSRKPNAKPLGEPVVALAQSQEIPSVTLDSTEVAEGTANAPKPPTGPLKPNTGGFQIGEQWQGDAGKIPSLTKQTKDVFVKNFLELPDNLKLDARNSGVFVNTFAKKMNLSPRELRQVANETVKTEVQLKQLKTIYDQNPDDTDTLYKLAELHNNLGQHDLAYEAYAALEGKLKKQGELEASDPNNPNKRPDYVEQRQLPAVAGMAYTQELLGNKAEAQRLKGISESRGYKGQEFSSVGAGEALQPGGGMTYDDQGQMVPVGSPTPESEYLNGIAQAIENFTLFGPANEMTEHGVGKVAKNLPGAFSNYGTPGKFSDAVGVFTGVVESLMGVAGMTTPAGALFAMPLVQAQNIAPEAAKWMMPLGVVLNEYYRQQGEKMPELMENVTVLADLGLLGFLTHAGVEGAKGLKAERDLKKIFENLPPKAVEQLAKVGEKRIEMAQGDPKVYGEQMALRLDELKPQVEQIKVEAEAAKPVEPYNPPPHPNSLRTVEEGSSIVIDGEEGIYEIGDDGTHYINIDGKSKQIKVADKFNPTETLKELGIEVLAEITPEQVARATADAEQVGRVTVNGKEYFVSLDRVGNENPTGDFVLEVKPDGTMINRFDSHPDPTFAKERKLKVINEFLDSKGLPKRSKITEVKGSDPLPKTEVEPVMEQDIPSDLQENGIEVVSMLEAERLHSDGYRMFGMHEQGEVPHEIFDVNELRNYSEDQLIAYEPSETEIKPIENEKANQEGRKEGLLDTPALEQPLAPVAEKPTPKEPVSPAVEVVETPPVVEAPLKNVESTAKALEVIENQDIEVPILDWVDAPLKENHQAISEAYHKAKADGSNPKLVKAVEDLLQQKKEILPPNEPVSPAVEVQIEDFGVPKSDVGAVKSLLDNVFAGLKKAGLTAFKTLDEWIGIGKGQAKEYSLKINGKEVKVKNTGVDVVNGFYSPLEKTILETKFDKLPAKQWIEKFAKGEEAKWTGLTEWLSQQQGSVSKADIQQYLKDNRISVVEVVKGDRKSLNKNNYTANKNEEGDYDVYFEGSYIGSFEDVKSENEAIESAIDSIDSDYLENTDEITKFSQYQVEGDKENYKEVLVTMPSKARSMNMRDWYDNVWRKEENPNAPKFEDLTDKEYDSVGDEWRYWQSRAEKDVKFKSSHFDEPNILVHLRMNTRTDAQGNKVLFLEEVQSDWGQKGKKEGFTEATPQADIDAVGRYNLIINEKKALLEKAPNYVVNNKIPELQEKVDKINDRAEIAKKDLPKSATIDFDTEFANIEVKKSIPQAPFVTDTNAWTKLGLKVALKEAVKQGADKIAWTTGEQQNNRYSLEKDVDFVKKRVVNGETFIDIKPKGKGGIVFKVDSKGKILENTGETITGAVGKNISDVIGKDVSERILASDKDTVIEGEGLKVGGKGMIDSYGSPAERAKRDNLSVKKEGELFAVKDEKGKTIRTFKQENEANKFKENYGLGIVGNVAKSLFKQEPKTVEVKLSDNLNAPFDITVKDEKGNITTHNFDSKSKASAWLSKEVSNGAKYEVISEKSQKEITSTQHSIDITPELRAEVEKGQPLFKDAEAQYHIQSGKNIIEAIKNFNGSKKATVAITHEVMHPTVVAIIDGAKSGVEKGIKHTDTIVSEYNKAKGKKITAQELIEGNDAFKEGTTSDTYRAVQEFIADSWEKYHREGGKGFSEAFQKVLEQITQAFTEVYKTLKGKELTPELRKMFDEILGKEPEPVKVKEPRVESPEEVLVRDLQQDIKNIGYDIAHEMEMNSLSEFSPDMYAVQNMPWIDPLSAAKETGGKVGTKGDINPSFVHKTKGVGVEKAGEILAQRAADDGLHPQLDSQDWREILIEILHAGSKESYIKNNTKFGKERTRILKQEMGEKKAELAEAIKDLENADWEKLGFDSKKEFKQHVRDIKQGKQLEQYEADTMDVVAQMDDATVDRLIKELDENFPTTEEEINTFYEKHGIEEGSVSAEASSPKITEGKPEVSQAPTEGELVVKAKPIKSSWESNIEALVDPEKGLGAVISKAIKEQQPFKESFLKRIGISLEEMRQLDDASKQKIQDQWVKSDEFKELSKFVEDKKSTPDPKPVTPPDTPLKITSKEKALKAVDDLENFLLNLPGIKDNVGGERMGAPFKAEDAVKFFAEALREGVEQGYKVKEAIERAIGKLKEHKTYKAFLDSVDESMLRDNARKNYEKQGISLDKPIEQQFGASHASVAEVRKSMGLTDEINITDQHRRDTKTVMKEGKQIAESSNVQFLADDIISGEKIPNAQEQAALVYEQTKLYNESLDYQDRIDSFTAKGELNAADQATIELANIRARQKNVMDALDVAGTKMGLAFRMRQLINKRDYSLVALEKRWTSASGGNEITPSVRKQLEARVKELEAEVKKSEELFKAKDKELADQAMLDIQEAMAREKTSPLQRIKAEKKIRKEELAKKYRGVFNDATNIAKAILEKDFYEYSKLVLEEVAGDIKEFAKRLIGDLGKNVEPYVQEIYDNASKKEYEKAFVDEVKGIQIDKQLIRDIVEQGVKDSQELVDKVFEAVKDDLPEGTTRREVQDAISEYGKQINPKIDPLQAEINSLKRDLKLESGLEDATVGKGVKRSGFTQPKPTPKQRGLKRRINDALKNHPQDQAEINKKWATALDRTKTALNNSITDLTKRLEDLKQGVATPKTPKERLKLDAEAEALKDMRDDLVKQIEEIEGKKKLSYEQRVTLAIEAAERTAQKYRNRTQEIKKTGTYTKETPVQLSSPELDIARAERDAAQAEFNQASKDANLDVIAATSKALRDSQDRVAKLEQKVRSNDISYAQRAVRLALDTPELKASKAAEKALRDIIDTMREEQGLAELHRMELWKNRAANRLKELERRVREKDYSKKVKKETPIDMEMERTAMKIDRAKFDLDVAIEVERYKNLQGWEKTGETLSDIFNIPKSIMASMDISAPFRQGAVLFARHPILGVKATKEMFKHLWSEKEANDWNDRLRLSDGYIRAKKSNLFISEPMARLVASEERFMSHMAEKIPVLGRGVKASNRAYSGFLNKIRTDVFNQHYEALVNEGFSGKELQSELSQMAHLINNFSGRGKLGKRGELASPLLNAAFFAPRYVTSRINTLANAVTGYWLEGRAYGSQRMSTRTRLEAYKALGAYVTVGVGVLQMAKAAGAEVEIDPRSSDFGKIKIGDLRYDIWAGFQQEIVLLARIFTQAKVDVFNGKVKKFNEGFGSSNTGSTLGNFLRSKASPQVGYALSAMTGTTMGMEEFDAGKELLRMFVPLLLQDPIGNLIYNDAVSMYKEGDAGIGTFAAGATGIGVGYIPKPKPVEDANLKERSLNLMIEKQYKPQDYKDDEVYVNKKPYIIPEDKMVKIKEMRAKEAGKLIELHYWKLKKLTPEEYESKVNSYYNEGLKKARNKYLPSGWKNTKPK